MKKWKCIVCGYIHEGDEPPESCPICGVPADQFVEVDEDGNEKS
ncbi:MAG: rubredoxin [Clostridiales bacterium]|nr:rubredoxin [Clostridiales bacterium]